MKKTLLAMALVFSGVSMAQTELLQNPNFEELQRVNSSGANSGSPCACVGWINRWLGNQAETSNTPLTQEERDANVKALKFDNLEADAAYQEVAVMPNTTYTFTYTWAVYDDDAGEPKSSLELRILKGSGYISGYTPSYTAATMASTSDYGYRSIPQVELASNNLIDAIKLTYPGTEELATVTVNFTTGTETSIAIFGRGLQASGAAVTDGDNRTDPDGTVYQYNNGTDEVFLKEVSLKAATTNSTDSFVFTNLSVYPNPATSILNVASNGPEAITGVEVFDVLGKKVLSRSDWNSDQINVDALNSGIYFLKVYSNDNSITRKIMIQ